MKTVNVLTRKMGDFNVFQRTSDGYFDANELLRQWNAVEGNPERNLKRFLESPKTKEFIDALISDLSHGAKMQLPDTQVFKIIKSKTLRDGSKTIGKAWMHPYLFIKFAMWINPKFEVQVIRFVHDQLIDYRDKAGDAYKRMSSALSRIIEPSRLRDKIQDLARSVNIIIYGLHQSMMRNSVGEEVKAKELMELEIDIAKMIEFGYITTEEQLRDYLYKVLRSKKALPL